MARQRDLYRLEQLACALSIVFYALLVLAFFAAILGSPGSGLLLLVLGAAAHVGRVGLEEFAAQRRAVEELGTGAAVSGGGWGTLAPPEIVRLLGRLSARFGGGASRIASSRSRSSRVTQRESGVAGGALDELRASFRALVTEARVGEGLDAPLAIGGLGGFGGFQELVAEDPDELALNDEAPNFDLSGGHDLEIDDPAEPEFVDAIDDEAIEASLEAERVEYRRRRAEAEQWADWDEPAAADAPAFRRSPARSSELDAPLDSPLLAEARATPLDLPTRPRERSRRRAPNARERYEARERERWERRTADSMAAEDGGAPPPERNLAAEAIFAEEATEPIVRRREPVAVAPPPEAIAPAPRRERPRRPDPLSTRRPTRAR